MHVVHEMSISQWKLKADFMFQVQTFPYELMHLQNSSPVHVMDCLGHTTKLEKVQDMSVFRVY